MFAHIDEVHPDDQPIVDAVERFALDVLRPVGRTLDAMADPAQVVADDSPLWDVVARYRELGVDPSELSDSGLPADRVARLQATVAERLGWGDAGLAISLEVSTFPRMLARLSGNPALMERFDRPGLIGCWAITEPDHGSDVLMYADHLQDMPGRPNCVARRDGDDWIIRGQKAAWVSNGTIAKSAALFCWVEPGSGPAGMGAFLVDLDDPAVQRGKPLDKLGQRSLNQGELFFDDLRVSAEHLVFPPMPGAGGMVLALANSSMGVTFSGVARAACEAAFEYTQQRQQGGGPIIRHQNVRGQLFSMFRRVEAARALSRHVMITNATAGPQVAASIASKVTATQTAFEVASDALGLFGGNGLSREYPIEKLLRDARASMIEDGSNDVLGLIAMDHLTASP
ncbi:MAG: acyl-CoA/acyl-ACP dehydrogenase [Microthrixaceae bacterium]|nr:acyl-CoA/acyl-ACP dehydrogenase [Acidimicrobiales bacterium]MCB9402853.1 acyl-CoA/acyl-ACP dehydrogenase [Microthrixaceae bacterium]